MSVPRIRLYQSPLQDVTYVYGYPVRFSSKAENLERREKDKEMAEQRAAAREAALERGARERSGATHG